MRKWPRPIANAIFLRRIFVVSDDLASILLHCSRYNWIAGISFYDRVPIGEAHEILEWTLGRVES